MHEKDDWFRPIPNDKETETMRTRYLFWLPALAVAVALGGCAPAVEKKPVAVVATQEKAAPTQEKAAAPAAKGGEEESEIQANLAKLSPEDRKLAEAQRFCAIED